MMVIKIVLLNAEAQCERTNERARERANELIQTPLHVSCAL